jgi:CheY-like chemotaxis protein
MIDRRRILLIDDSDIVLAALTAMLTQAGFEVRPVSSLRQFLNTILDWKPHLIVTDLYMPDMNGAELCAWLRGHAPTASTPVVI